MKSVMHTMHYVSEEEMTDDVTILVVKAGNANV
jgi:hypothetical protein